MTKKLNCNKTIYYSSHNDNIDLWDTMIYSKSLQQGNTKGESLADADTKVFALEKKRVITIGTDCIDLESYMIKEVFAVLESNDVVLGPSKTGGYYLLVKGRFLPTLFTEKDWESENLLMDATLGVKNLDFKYYLSKNIE